MSTSQSEPLKVMSEFKKRLSGVYTRDVAFPYYVPSGYPGVVTRLDTPPVIATEVYSTVTANQPTFFGEVVAVDSAGVRVLATGDSSFNPLTWGFLARPYPTQQNSTTGSIGSGTPNMLSLANVMKRGYMIVTLQNTTAAAKGGQVTVRTVLSGSLVVGAVEATAATTNVVAITGCYFTGPADSTGLVEIAFNI